jgi:hypothetical protein
MIQPTPDPNYIDVIAARIAAKLDEGCGLSMAIPQEARLLRLYALLVLTRGTLVTTWNVHDAWATWQADINPHHRALVPFVVQALDLPYARAIRDVAAEMAGTPTP